MLVDPSMEKMLPSVDCAYELAVLVSKRARQLVEGGQPLVKDEAANMVSLACYEVAQGKVVRVKGDKSDEIVVPKTKAARDAERAAQLAKEEAEKAREMERAVSNAISAVNTEEEEQKAEPISASELSFEEFDPNEELVTDSTEDEE